LIFSWIYFKREGGANGITKIIWEQREWGRKIYEVTDRRASELRPLGYSDVRIAWEVTEELKAMGYVPRKDVYSMFAFSWIREFRKISQKNDLDTWVRFFLDF
jgi:hypothetical protein